MNKSSSSNAKDFFNSISKNYKKKYANHNQFHFYFFNERLQKATKGLLLNGKKVLDVGAGTGDLYDHISKQYSKTEYCATDVAAGMLENSLIPSSSRYLGAIPHLELPHKNFDFIFMLGVSTYLTPHEMNEHLNYFAHHVELNSGQVVITFTNKYSLDNLFRTLLKPVISILRNKDTVLSQNILIQKYTYNEAIDLFTKAGFKVRNVEWLNHTIFPFNLIFKKPSISLAIMIDRFSNQTFLSLLSSDFMIKASLK
jgi:SAM-dependent methyltransferase